MAAAEATFALSRACEFRLPGGVRRRLGLPPFAAAGDEATPEEVITKVREAAAYLAKEGEQTDGTGQMLSLGS